MLTPIVESDTFITVVARFHSVIDKYLNVGHICFTTINTKLRLTTYNYKMMTRIMITKNVKIYFKINVNKILNVNCQ